ncbi:hypothetical protein VNO77_24968 [Canavalia gladiata]|uniref:Uncharacterized protein n=1 Tax=Canavalia gladiata TaxID=3824 RepID=A0AAN9QD73_CANGL
MGSKAKAFDEARKRGTMIAEELRSSQKDFRMRGNEVWRPKIQKVPDYMGGRQEFKTSYTPTLISIGPLHWYKLYMGQGSEYKRRWTAMYLQDTNQTYDCLFERLYSSFEDSENILWCSYNCVGIEGEDNYQDENIKHSNDDNGTKDWMETYFMLMEDGCSILQVLDRSLGSKNPEKELMVSTDKLVRVHQDLLLLENQLPYEFLKLICNDTARLKRCMRNFLVIHGVEKNEELSTIVQVQEEKEEEEPLHLLDYLRRTLLRRDHMQIHKEIKLKKMKRRSLHFRKYRIGTIRELQAAGIQVSKCPHSTSFYPSFDTSEGKLQLPEITVDGSTATMFLNLIAYEMCPDFNNNFEISSFIVFLSSLIDQPEDAKELRLAGILRNELATDKEVADLFNKMDIVLVPETTRFADIRDQIEAHFASKRGKIKVMGWMVEAYNNYFRSPWAIIALLAAILGLTLTFIQTWYAIHPKGS